MNDCRADEVVLLALAVPLAADERDDVQPRPEQRPDLDRDQPCLLCELAPNRILGTLARLDPAAGRRPDGPRRELETDEQDAVVRVEHDRTSRRTDAELAHDCRRSE